MGGTREDYADAFIRDLKASLQKGLDDRELVRLFNFKKGVELRQAKEMLACYREAPDPFMREMRDWIAQDTERHDEEWEALVNSLPTSWGRSERQAINEFEERWKVPRWLRLADVVHTS